MASDSVLKLLLFVLATGSVHPRPLAAAELELEWCTGISPVSWGFTVEPPAACHEIRVRPTGDRARILAAEPGPGLPDGWKVSLDGAEAVARGEAPTPAGERLETLFLLETNRSSGSVDRAGVEPITWQLSFADAEGARLGGARVSSFPPVFELGDAASRGLIKTTIETIAPSGPIEITVDNPTFKPLWLDLPPGSVLSAGGDEWVVGLARPFRMMRKQKTGKTIMAYPVHPPTAGASPPRRLSWEGRQHELAEEIAELAMAIRLLEDSPRAGGRRPGIFEEMQPFEFWPLVLKWSVWKTTSEPDPGILVDLVRSVIEQRAAAGDAYAGRMEPTQAAAEVEQAYAALTPLRESVRSAPLSIELQASGARFD